MSEPSTTDRIHGLRILPVDDEPDILETIFDVLDGAMVDCAGSYQAAIELLTPAESDGPVGRNYDLVVLQI
jgi:CheY-like chemotaxis protein